MGININGGGGGGQEAGAQLILVVDNNADNDGVNERGKGVLPAAAVAVAVKSKFAMWIFENNLCHKIESMRGCAPKTRLGNKHEEEAEATLRLPFMWLATLTYQLKRPVFRSRSKSVFSRVGALIHAYMCIYYMYVCVCLYCC